VAFAKTRASTAEGCKLQDEKPRPKGWIFDGFFAWALWGYSTPPGLHDGFKAKLFFTEDGGIKRKMGGLQFTRKT